MNGTAIMSVTDLEQRVHETTAEVYRSKSFKVIGRDADLAMVVSPSEARLLQETVERFGARNTLETGMGSGLSAAHIMLGIQKNGGGHHTAIDPYQKGELWKGLGLDFVKYCGFSDMFTWVCEKSDTALARMVAEGKKIDLAFIDGNHRFEGALVDFYFIDQMLDVGGVVVFDDADWPPVRRVVNFALRHRNYERVGGSPVELGPIVKPWGWKVRRSRRARYQRLGWPAGEANHPQPFETVVVRKTAEDQREWTFWQTLE